LFTTAIEGDLVTIAKLDIPADQLGALHRVGIYDVVKSTGEINAGAGVYWNATGNPIGGEAGSGAATATAGSNKFMGWAVKAAANEDPIVRLALFGSPAITNNHYGPLNNAIADPGDAGAIPVAHSGTVAIVTEGAETRTLAVPTFIGQELLIYFEEDGGDAVLTVAEAINATGNNTVTFSGEGDFVRLIAIKTDTDGLLWRVSAIDGATPSTV